MRPICFTRFLTQHPIKCNNNSAFKPEKTDAKRTTPNNTSAQVEQLRKFSEDWGRRGRGGPFFDDLFDKQLADAFQDAVKSFQTAYNNPRYYRGERGERGDRGDRGDRTDRGDRGERKEEQQREQSKEIKERESKDLSPFGSFFSSNWNTFDIKEKDDGFEFKANIESFDPKDIKIEVKDGFLNISGKSKEEKSSVEGGFKRTHKSEQSFHHKFFIPENTDINQSKAAFNNGTLTIQIPKTTKEDAKKLEIPIDFAKKD